MKGCRPLSDKEISSVLRAIERGCNPPRDRALFLLGLRSGFRISELLSLTVGDVYQSGQYLNYVGVARKHMKKKREGRTIALHEEAKGAVQTLVEELLKSSRTNSKTPLFLARGNGNKAISRKTAWHMLTRMYKQAGVFGKVACHGMRKTFAKRVHEKLGKDLMKTQKALGHAQITSTVSYLSFAEDEIEDAILKS